MDSILSDFIGRTHADPALAQDLLDAADWNMESALAIFDGLKDTRAVEPEEYQYDPKDFEHPSVSESDDHAPEWEGQDGTSINSSVLGSISEVGDSGSNLDENEAQRRVVVRRQRRHRGRGLSFMANDVVDKFNKVAISKLKVSSKEQMSIDEKFFHHSFSYPDFSDESEELQEFIANDLLETTHKKSLERSGRLNWWTTTGKLPRLEPLATSGDGNCLLHAASLYMWGIHDRELILRTALHRLLTTSRESERIRRRWRYQTQLRNNEAGGLTFSEEEWDFEWGEIIRIATNQPRRQPTTASLRRYSSLRFSYESLEEIHIFALAHVLRRPIIVIADSAIKNLSGEDLAPIYFGGIYLPLEIAATACSKTPVVLAYDASHFSPLVARRDTLKENPRVSGRFSRHSSRTETVIPLVAPTGALLPVQFIIDPRNRQVTEKWGEMKYSPGEFPDEIIHLLDHYLKIRWIQLNVTSVTSQSTDQDYDHLFPVEVPKVRFPAAVISQEAQPIYQKELIEKYLINIREKYTEEKERLAEREREKERKLQEIPVPCEGAGCDMFGKGATNNLCSKCYQKWQDAKAGVHVGEKNMAETMQEDELESGPDRQFNTSHPPPPKHTPPSLPPKQLPPVQSPTKQLHSVQPPPRYQFPPKQLPPIQPPPSRPPPLYSASSATQHHYMDSDDDLHRDKHQQPQLQNKPVFSNASTSPQHLTDSRTERKTSPSRSANTKPPTSHENSTAAANGGNKSKPKGSPGHSSTEVAGKDKSWAKKLKPFTNLSPFSKPSSAKSGSGYTRDSIQPIKLAEGGGGARPSTQMSRSTQQRTKCANPGCEFFGCAETNGYCSSCFKDIQKHGPVVAV